MIHDWPSQSSKNATQEKVPSEVAYREEGILWGALLPADVPRHMWTKLQLDPLQAGEVTKINREIATSAQNANKQPDDVITDFLTQVKAHLIKNLDQKYGTALWRTMPITLVVTVPATWSDLAKSRTLEAVNRAGFNTQEFPQPVTTILTTEPEAAAIHTMRTYRGESKSLCSLINPRVLQMCLQSDLTLKRHLKSLGLSEQTILSRLHAYPQQGYS